MARLLKGLLREERAATTVEYGLMIALIVVASLAVLSALSDGVFDVFDTSNTALQTTSGAAEPTTLADAD